MSSKILPLTSIKSIYHIQFDHVFAISREICITLNPVHICTVCTVHTSARTHAEFMKQLWCGVYVWFLSKSRVLVNHMDGVQVEDANWMLELLHLDRIKYTNYQNIKKPATSCALCVECIEWQYCININGMASTEAVSSSSSSNSSNGSSIIGTR